MPPQGASVKRMAKIQQRPTKVETVGNSFALLGLIGLLILIGFMVYQAKRKLP